MLCARGRALRYRLGVLPQNRPPDGFARALPAPAKLVGRARVELATSRLSGVRSNHLSYRPIPRSTLSRDVYEPALKRAFSSDEGT